MNTKSKMPTNPRARWSPTPHGLTLVEVLVSIIIIMVLAGIVLLTGGTVRNARKRATAEQQMAAIAAAIEQYAAFWPRWEVFDAAGKVVLADKGWPDFIPGRLFVPSGLGGPFGLVPGFNHVSGSHDPLFFDVADITYSQGRQSFDSSNSVLLAGYVLNANACLAYCLTTSSGKGPFIEDKPGAGLVDVAGVHKQTLAQVYPPYSGSVEARRQEVFVDPWGTPYRYFWVYRDVPSGPAPASHKGFLPVDYGAYLSGDGTGGVGNPSFYDNGVAKKAATFVLESAGPDKAFGNVWRRSPGTLDLDQAWDNPTVMP